jgi:hypothetical protein
MLKIVSGNPLNRKASLWRKPDLGLDGGDNDQHNLSHLVTLENEGIKK